jgi:hypothetical protein
MTLSRFKYPRTRHFNFSPGIGSDDKIITNYSRFEGQEVIGTIKMDGENTSLYSDGYVHARSMDGVHHPSRDWVKKFWSERSYLLPTGYRVCGENMYARHSLCYNDLDSYFYGFSVWDNHNRCLAWDDTLYYFQELGITPVQEVYRGTFDLNFIRNLCEKLDIDKVEGIVIRLVRDIPSHWFDTCVAKYVRKGHVQTDKHWAHQEIIHNSLKKPI